MSKAAKKFSERVRELFVGHKGRRLNELGQEVPDPTPMAPPVGYTPRPSLSEQIREMVRSERLRMEAEMLGAESFEDADDFDISDDPVDPSTPYESVFEGRSVSELRAARAAAEEAPPSPAPAPEEPFVPPAAKPASNEPSPA